MNPINSTEDLLFKKLNYANKVLSGEVRRKNNQISFFRKYFPNCENVAPLKYNKISLSGSKSDRVKSLVNENSKLHTLIEENEKILSFCKVKIAKLKDSEAEDCGYSQKIKAPSTQPKQNALLGVLDKTMQDYPGL